MRQRNLSKRRYRTPLSRTTEVDFEQDLLVGTGRFQSEADELEHRFSTMNADGTPSQDEPLYFEF